MTPIKRNAIKLKCESSRQTIDNDIGTGGKYVLIGRTYEKSISFHNPAKEESLHHYRRTRRSSKKK